jgi:hypothetical protein
MVGYNQESKKTNNLSVTTQSLFNNDKPIIDLANTHNLPNFTGTIWAVQGAFFRLNYDYMQRYLLEVNGNADRTCIRGRRSHICHILDAVYRLFQRGDNTLQQGFRTRPEIGRTHLDCRWCNIGILFYGQCKKPDNAHNDYRNRDNSRQDRAFYKGS